MKSVDHFSSRKCTAGWQVHYFFVSCTNSLLNYLLIYGEKKWMTKTEMTESTP